MFLGNLFCAMSIPLRIVLRKILTKETLCFCRRLGPPLELLGEWLVVEEEPRVVELVIPGVLQVPYGRDQLVQLFVSNERDERRIGARGIAAVGGVIVFFGPP